MHTVNIRPESVLGSVDSSSAMLKPHSNSNSTTYICLAAITTLQWICLCQFSFGSGSVQIFKIHYFGLEFGDMYTISFFLHSMEQEHRCWQKSSPIHFYVK